MQKRLYSFSALKYNTVIPKLPNKKGRQTMKKTFVMILAALLLCSLFAGCKKQDGSSDLNYIKEKGTLIVGITEYEPMDYKDENGEWTGFDAEFARLVGEKLGVAVEFQLIEWGNKIFELDSKSIDCIWNGMTITEEVELNTSCTNAYAVNAQVVVMKQDALADYADAESLKGLKIAVEDGSSGEEVLNDLGITGYLEKEDQAGVLMEVAAGAADACVLDITMANFMTGEGTSYADLGYSLRLAEEEYGIGFRKGSDVTAEVNKIMADLVADGTLPALAEKYSLTLVQ